VRVDFEIINELIRPGARVLDLGCGGGELLAHLSRTKNIHGYGLDCDPDNITSCINKGVSVIEQNLNDGLANFDNDSFDMVVMTEALQAVQNPSHMLDEMLRIGDECIVTFPNFAHWSCRAHLVFKGRMPVARHLPHDWYNTPNIHLCTFRDFENLCATKSLRIIHRRVLASNHRKGPLAARFPNFFGNIAFYQLGRSQ